VCDVDNPPPLKFKVLLKTRRFGEAPKTTYLTREDYNGECQEVSVFKDRTTAEIARFEWIAAHGQEFEEFTSTILEVT
jgi:hypothetical protein